MECNQGQLKSKALLRVFARLFPCSMMRLEFRCIHSNRKQLGTGVCAGGCIRMIAITLVLSIN